MVELHNTTDTLSFRIGLYNYRGYNDQKKKQFITSLVRSVNLDLLLLQEHWLAESHLNSLANIRSHMVSCGMSGFDNSDVLAGRPYGGCAIFWRSGLMASVTRLTC